MASKFKFETRDERIERMHENNPGRDINLCTMVVDGMWDQRRKLQKSRIPERFADAKIEDLGNIESSVNEAVGEMLLDPTKNDKIGTIFSGPAGTGKTYAAYAVINKMLEKNPEMISHMTTHSESFSKIKSEFYNGDFEEMGSSWDRLNNESGLYDGLLLFDDLSSKKLTEFELDKILMFLEKRFNYYMPFIITTNVKVEDFVEVFGERIASRLLGYCNIVEFKEDKRVKK